MTTDKTMNIAVHNVNGWVLDEAMLAKALTVCAQHLHSGGTADVYPQERVPADAPAYRHPGWLEWVVRVHYPKTAPMGKGTLQIGLIQRTVGAPIESHT